MLTYAELAQKASELIYQAIVRSAGSEGADIVKAMLDPYNPHGYTDHVSFITTKQNLWGNAGSPTSTMWSATAIGKPSLPAWWRRTPQPSLT